MPGPRLGTVHSSVTTEEASYFILLFFRQQVIERHPNNCSISDKVKVFWEVSGGPQNKSHGGEQAARHMSVLQSCLLLYCSFGK